MNNLKKYKIIIR